MVTTAALIVGAGRGHRFGGELPKQYCPLGGVPIIQHSLRAFLRHPGVDTAQAVIHADDHALFAAATEGVEGIRKPVDGGASRQESVRIGLESLADVAPERVLIHDAARPFVNPRLVSRVLSALKMSAGAIPGLPVGDTLKRVVDKQVIETVDRSGLWRAQTPQGFRYTDILHAHRAASGQELTDDAAVAEASGMSVALVAGDEQNIKVTTRDDLVRAEQCLGHGQPRTGMGFDVHRFGPGDHVILCGVKVPHDRGLEGHSDADVGLHALTDALLGTVGGGDIGDHFPPTDAQWRDVASGVFLRHAAGLIEQAGGRITSIDVTLICECPKVAPHREAMRERIADLLEMSKDMVNVKATTTERLGFTGRGEGIAAQVIATAVYA